MAERIAQEKEREVLEAYTASGLRGRQIGRRFGIGTSTLYRVLRRNNVAPIAKPGPLPKLDIEQERQVAALYAEGVRPPALAARFSCSTGTIRKVVRRAGVPSRRRGGQARPWTEPEIGDMIARYQVGESQEVIARAHGTHQTQVSRILTSRGVYSGKPSRERHGSWKGGRVRLDGYIAVLLPDDHPFASMRGTGQYVKEHRLAMAEALGRPLEPNETVHHINGNKEDNRVENLQLRKGRHGKGVAMVCADCGSHNIVSRTIA